MIICRWTEVCQADKWLRSQSERLVIVVLDNSDRCRDDLWVVIVHNRKYGSKFLAKGTDRESRWESRESYYAFALNSEP